MTNSKISVLDVSEETLMRLSRNLSAEGQGLALVHIQTSLDLAFTQLEKEAQDSILAAEQYASLPAADLARLLEMADKLRVLKDTLITKLQTLNAVPRSNADTTPV